MIEQNMPHEEVEKMSTAELWQAKNYEEIVSRMVKRETHVYNDDYDFKPDLIIDQLELKDIIEKDEMLPAVRQLANGNENHYLVSLRKRELILQQLLPMLEQLPAYDDRKGEVSGGLLADNPDIDKRQLAYVTNGLMWAGATAAAGTGYKMIDISPEDLKKILSEGGAELEKKLADTNSKTDRMYNILRQVRGDELGELMQGMFKRGKDHDLASAKEQGIDVSVLEKELPADAEIENEPPAQ